MAPDRVMLLAPPFDMAQAEVVASSEDALSGHTYARDGTAAFLEGDGFKADFRPRPFIDRVTIVSAEKTRLFEGSADSYDRPLAALDDELSV